MAHTDDSEPVSTYLLIDPDGDVAETYTATAHDMCMHFDGIGGYGYRIVDTATGETVMVCEEDWTDDFYCAMCDGLMPVADLVADSYVLYGEHICKSCRGVSVMRVIHKTARTLGTIIAGPVESLSPYNPGTWIQVRVDNDGFTYWTLTDSVLYVSEDPS